MSSTRHGAGPFGLALPCQTASADGPRPSRACTRASTGAPAVSRSASSPSRKHPPRRRRATADPFGLRREYRRPPKTLAQDPGLSRPRHRRPVGRTGDRPPTGHADRSGRPSPSPAAIGAGRPGQYQPPRPKPRHGTRRGWRPPRHPAKRGAARPRPVRTVGALPAHPARRGAGRQFGLRAQTSTAFEAPPADNCPAEIPPLPSGLSLMALGRYLHQGTPGELPYKTTDVPHSPER